MSPLGSGCRKGGSSLALLPKHLFWGSKVLPKPCRSALTLACEALSLAELSLRKSPCHILTEHFPLDFIPAGLCSEPLVPGMGMEMPNKKPVKECL